jgi:hypothetical protein
VSPTLAGRERREPVSPWASDLSAAAKSYSHVVAATESLPKLQRQSAKLDLAVERSRKVDLKQRGR